MATVILFLVHLQAAKSTAADEIFLLQTAKNPKRL